MGEEEGGEETHAYARTGLAHGNTSQVTMESVTSVAWRSGSRAGVRGKEGKRWLQQNEYSDIPASGGIEKAAGVSLGAPRRIQLSGGACLGLCIPIHRESLAL